VALAGLGITRQARRRREIALRYALGAGRRQVVLAVAEEGIVVSLAGGALGIGIAGVGLRLLRVAGLPSAPGGLGAAAIVAGLLLLAGSVLLVGIVPALRASRSSPSIALRSSAPAAGRPGPGRRAAVGMEAGLAVLLCCAGLLLARTVMSLLAVHPGFRTSHVLVARLSLSPAQASSGAPAALLGRIRAMPGVRAAAVAATGPLGGFIGTAPVSLAPGSVARQIAFTSASPGFLRAAGIGLLAGRGFVAGDNSRGQSVVLVNEAFARRAFGGESAVGRTIWIGSGRREAARVVGVLADFRQAGWERAAAPEIVFPFAQMPSPLLTLVIWARQRPEALVPGLRRLANALAPGAPLFGVTTTSAIEAHALARPRAEMALFGLLAALTLALAVFAVFSVTAAEVQAGRREIAIRKALGATNARILGEVLRWAVLPAAAGVGGGLLAASALTRSLAALLYGVKPLDPATFALAAALAMIAVLAAGLGPARRAAGLEPVQCLRDE
ncbi:MAG: FtsX-like permease family protein, partial [Terriglobales bacterium]